MTSDCWNSARASTFRKQASPSAMTKAGEKWVSSCSVLALKKFMRDTLDEVHHALIVSRSERSYSMSVQRKRIEAYILRLAVSPATLPARQRPEYDSRRLSGKIFAPATIAAYAH